MVDNSLGRMWYEGHPSESFKEKLKYYIDDAKQEADIQAQVDAIKQKYSQLKPEELKCIDPCCGSGHILVYFFDVLMNIYQEYGYSTREAAISIIENNIWGLDIDERAAQLAYFSIMMKARAYDRRFFSRNIQPHVYEIRESNNLDQAVLEDIYQKNKDIATAIKETLEELYDAKEYGSLLKIGSQDWNIIFNKLKLIDSIYGEVVQSEIIPILEVAKALSQHYDVVVTNPPYLSGANMDAKLSHFLKKEYRNSKADTYTSFIKRCALFNSEYGLLSMITMESWMFLTSFRDLREQLIQDLTVVNLIHMPYSGRGKTSLGINFGTSAFTISKRKIHNYNTQYEYITYKEIDDEGIPFEFPTINARYQICKQENFLKIPNYPMAYWVSKNILNNFSRGITLEEISDFPGSQHKTADNDKYLRCWYEINYNDFGKNWIPYVKGGPFRKWYGNLLLVVDWSKEAKEFYKNNKTSNIIDQKYWFKEGITYTSLSSRKVNSFRYLPPIGVFDIKGPSFVNVDHLYYALALFNSKVVGLYLNIFNSTITLQVRDVKAVPVIIDQGFLSEISSLSKENVKLAKLDWNSDVISWNFKKHSLIKDTSKKISDNVEKYRNMCIKRFEQMKHNEERLNSLFAKIYNLESEIAPNVEENLISIRIPTIKESITSFVDYAVGCMFGRYSLDKEGLIYAGGEWDPSQYKTYCADEDNVLPITDDDYFEDDIVDRFVKFVEIVYGTDTLDENLKFIADALGNKGSTSREVIRNYFLSDFFKDHCQTYSVTGFGKRPIYWLFDSGKKNGFKCLIYMHRYTPDTLARIRTDYVHLQQARYQTAIEDIERQLVSANGSEKVRLNERLKKLKDQAEETRIFEEKLHHLADQMINIDLDDGVKHNYALFKDVLAKIK
jgi:hypothetical protein